MTSIGGIIPLIARLRIPLVIAFVQAFFYLLFFEPRVSVDAEYYLTTAERLLHGQGFFPPPYSQELFYLSFPQREPLYPLMIAGIYAVFGRHQALIYMLQLVMLLSIVVFAFIIAKRIFSERVGIGTAYGIALYPALPMQVAYLHQEITFTFLLMLASLLTIRSFQHNRITIAVLAGVSWGAATLLRTAGGLGVIAAAIAYLWRLRSKNLRVGAVGRLLMAFSLSFLAVVSPWLARNWLVIGTPVVRVGAGWQLWPRAAQLDYPDSETFVHFVYGYSRALGAVLFPEYNHPDIANEAVFGNWEREYVIVDQLARQGFSGAEIDRILLTDALVKIRQSPFRYAYQSLYDLAKGNCFGFFFPELFKQKPRIELPASFVLIAPGQKVISILYRVLSFPILFFTTVLGIVVTRRCARAYEYWIFCAALVVVTNVAHSLVWVFARQNMPLIPFYLMYSSALFLIWPLRNKGIVPLPAPGVDLGLRTGNPQERTR